MWTKANVNESFLARALLLFIWFKRIFNEYICNAIYIVIEMIKCTHDYIGQKGFASA